MISDGVADPNRDEWLQDLLAGWNGDDPQTLANLILSESIRRERLQDDCAVQVLYRLPESEQPVSGKFSKAAVGWYRLPSLAGKMETDQLRRTARMVKAFPGGSWW